jgi:hypothetical protein
MTKLFFNIIFFLFVFGHAKAIAQTQDFLTLKVKKSNWTIRKRAPIKIEITLSNKNHDTINFPFCYRTINNKREEYLYVGFKSKFKSNNKNHKSVIPNDIIYTDEMSLLYKDISFVRGTKSFFVKIDPDFLATTGTYKIQLVLPCFLNSKQKITVNSNWINIKVTD